MACGGGGTEAGCSLPGIAVSYTHLDVYKRQDVDSLDAAFMPATGLPIPGGPDPAAVTDLLTALAATGKMVALDCVEYNPDRDPDGSSCQTVLGILEPVLLTLAEKH